ncbi:MAG: circadian clock protein KaiC [Fimbriimonas sp.]
MALGQEERPTGKRTLEKAPTGIDGFDEITAGGLPKGRPTLVCGSAGCGKTLFSMEFLVRGATEFGEPGVFVAFEESEEDLATNVASLGFDLDALREQNLIRLDQIVVERSEIEETGEYDLEGLFIRLGYAIDSIGAKRVVLDTIETLFSGLSNAAILRNELQRLFRWLKEKGVTTVITGERGDGALTRQGLEEYVSDCVILLDHRVQGQVSTRRLRVVKYRGSVHGTNEYPFLIDRDGFSVLPVTTMGLAHGTSNERVSSGVDELDKMLGGGYYRGSSVLVTGTAGTGKSSLSAHFANATCAAGERCLYFAFEESPAQIVRNMGTIGLDLQRWLDAGSLQIHSTRPMHYGLEMHLATIQRTIRRFKPSAVIIDPVTNFEAVGSPADVNAMLIRLVDMLKAQGVTCFFVTLTNGGSHMEATDVGMSSLMDTWLLVRDMELNGERNRGFYVLKSRGMNHSNQIREFVITSEGIHLLDAYLGQSGVLTGSARVAQEARERAERELAAEEAVRQRAVAEQRRRALEAQIAALQAELQAEGLAAEALDGDEQARLLREQRSREAMARSRRVTATGGRKD